MQKWGKNRNGSTRFRCKYCGLTATRKRQDLTQKYKRELFACWLLGKLSLTEIASQYKVSRHTVNRWFTPFWSMESLPKEVNISGKVLIIDGKYVERNACVLVACTLRGVASWCFTGRETIGSWLMYLGTLRHFPFAIVCDGGRGMLKAIKLRFPGVIIQRCQFHVMSYCLVRLTKHPENIASIELRAIVNQIAQVKTKQEFGVWLGDYLVWRKTHHDFIKEKTYHDTLTPTGRKRWSYTHGRLHAANSHLKNSIPNLFKYLLYPQIPNTTNFVEGGINSPMQEKLRFHRGLNLQKRRVLIAHYLASKQ